MIIQSAEAYLNGQVLVIDKPKGWTSFQVVKKIRFLIKKKYNLKKIKVGHAGTLDPLATGVLILCTGKLTKKINLIQNQNKIYVGTITLGGTTPSYDLETPINNNFKTEHLNKDLIIAKSKKFIGTVEQKPPIFSALKKDGERLYVKARKGEKVNIQKRKVFIKSFKITEVDGVNVHFKIECGKGTYIRSIAHDLGADLSCGGYLSKLKRIAVGEYNLTKSLSLENETSLLKL